VQNEEFTRAARSRYAVRYLQFPFAHYIYKQKSKKLICTFKSALYIYIYKQKSKKLIYTFKFSLSLSLSLSIYIYIYIYTYI